MSQLKKFTFLAAIGLIVAKISFAAIVDISKTQFSSNVNVKTMSAPTSGGGHTSSSSGVTCGAVTATTSAGCNSALGISSGAIATACDGGLYTCTKPVAAMAAAPVCDAGAKASIAECNNQGATAVECDEAGKYNCECPANYTKTCSGSGQYADPSEVCITSKNEQLIADTSSCLVNCLTGASGVTIYATQAETAGCKGAVSKCYQTSAGDFRYQCDQTCAAMDKLYPQYQRTLNCATLNGIDTGMTCGSGVNLCKCSTSNYMENFDELASCSNPGERPLTTNPCVAENPLKPDKTCANGVDGEGFCLSGNKNPRLCGFPDCQPADMNTMNQVFCAGSNWYIVGGSTVPAYTALTNPSVNGYSLDTACTLNSTIPTISLAGGTVFKYSCSLTKFAGCSSSAVRFSRVNVCGCDNTTYKYVPSTTTYTEAEITAKGLTKCNAGEQVLVDNPLNKNFCAWDAQTSFAAADSDTTGSNAKVATIDENKIVYSKGCMAECAAWELSTPVAGAGGTCTSGKVLGSCAKFWQNYSIFSKSVPLYSEYQYCSCPKDADGNDIYKDSCPSGQYLGGKTCDNNGVTLYQYCLKPCDGSGDRKYTSLATADATCGFEQGMSGIDVDDHETIQNNFYACFVSNKAAEVSFQCRCPSNYYSNGDCAADNGKIGTGTECKLDNIGAVDSTKYQNCSKECESDQQATLVDTKEGCNFADGNLANSQNAVECYKDKTMYQCLCPSNYQSKLEHCGGSLSGSSTNCDATCRTCMDKTIGIGKACTFESKIGGTQDADLYKYHQTLGWGESCSYLQSQANNLLTIKDNGCEFSNVGYCYNASQNLQNICKCPDTYKTLDEFCAGGDADCLTSYIGIGKPCSLDVSGVGGSPAKLEKYASFGKKCPASSTRPVFENKESCTIGAVSGVFEECYDTGNNGETKYICNCPATFDRTCADTTQVRGGAVCSFETIDPSKYKFEKCLSQCQNTATTPVVANAESCPMVDGFQANTEEQCFNKLGDASANYACRCPKGQNYQTLAEFCAAGATFDGITYTTEECLARVTGVGIACTYDRVGVNKYRNFSVVCPTNRPLLNSPNDCSSTVPGEVDYYCYERNNSTQQKVVCKCPSSWVDISGNSGGANVCGATKEPSGQTCSFDGDRNLKYAQCYTRCDRLPSNGKGVSYLPEEDNSKLECTNLLGDGATLGVDGDGEGCSRNNSLLYPCYCGATYVERCLNSDNEMPAPGALACTVGGSTYYESCANNACSAESSTIAIIADMDADASADILCRADYGSGATGKRCGEQKIECTCNSRQYTETCEYPYSAPDTSTVSWCKYSTDGKLMSAGKPHFQLGQCKVKENLAKCGKSILNSDGTENTSYTIKVAATENACKTTYGNGVSTQLCEYEDNINKRAYNCYYKASDFMWTENNCPVRHVLSSEYIISGGTKYYKTCDCHSAYKFHKYNCAGMLSGGTCEQKVGSKKATDSTLSALPDDTLLSFYPYCQCTADYNQVCDGERNVGVGEPCNGKYIACECKPDALPENWADNYYGCAGGKKPTGITKPNGCGGKYYQCSVTQCTWQHSEKCATPLIGLDGCQDNEGNIGGYKSCKCPDGYVVCPTGTVGTGEPCLLKGKYYYKESNCVSEGKCVHGETQTCTGPLQIGVNPCTRNGVTYFEYCVCASGYNKKCDGNNEVGVGSYCTLNETKFYAQCTNPSMTCTSEHKIACDTNQTSYDPCINSDNKVMYKCKCPSNYSKCEETGPAGGADSCKDTTLGTIYSACAVTNECTSAQNSSYKVCSEFQIGAGGSCMYTGVDGKSITKYAKCQETSECRANGYQYTCLGYDSSVQTEACVDENGNKLYKECKCPSTWIECTGKNNTKGQSCVPLNNNGVNGKTVYETCTCDASIYKYTCAQDTDAGNIGISGGSGKACTITQEGGDVTKYESCVCNAAYKYTCTGNGQVGDDADYCQATPSSTKLYKKCECKAEFNKSCDFSSANPGMTKPQDANLSCTAQNPSDGNANPRYSKCECGALYTLSCTGTNQIGEDKNSCMDNDGNKKYKACGCDETTYKYNCASSGYNKGITLPSNSADRCSKQSYQNDILTQVDYYKSCSCQSGYTLTCDKATDANKYSVLSTYNLESDYCEIPKTVASEDGGVTDIKVRTYSQCPCKNNFKACDSGFAAPAVGTLNDGDYCINIDNGGRSQTLYAEGVCQCTPVVPAGTDGWKPAGISITGNNTTVALSDLTAAAQTSLRRTFLTECNDENNGALTTDKCGNVYYKCVIDPVQYPNSAANCVAPYSLQGSTQTASTWLGTSLTMYQKCDCSSSVYKYTSDSECLTFYSNSGGASTSNHKLFCTSANYSSSPYSTRVSCGSMIFKLDNASGCSFKDGSGTKYSACTCKRGGEPISGDACISAYCGLPSTGGDDFACWANDKRISVYNGGGARSDSTCVCPTAKVTRDLDGCGGSRVGESVSSCAYQ